MSAYRNCQFCGETIDANASFCNHCKSALNQPAAPGARPAPPAPPPRTTAPPPPAMSQGPGMPPPAPTPPGMPSTASPKPSTPPAQASVPPTAAAPAPPPQVPVVAPAPPAAPPAAPAAPAQPVPTAAPIYYQAPQPGRKGSGGLIAIVLALVLLLGGGGAAVYYLFLKPAEPPAISSTLPTDTAAGQQGAQQAQTQTQQPVVTQPVQQPQTQQKEQPTQTQPVENPTYFVITEPGSNLFIRKSPGRTNKTSDDVITKVPRGTRLEVINQHGGSIRIDGFIWWEIKDPATYVRGWVAAEYLSTNASDVQR